MVTQDDLLDGLVSYWKFDETSGTTASDSHGSNDGTVSGDTWVSGKINNCLSFDGSDDYVAMGDVLDDVIVGSSAKFTVSSWVKKSGDGMFISKYADTQHGENGRQLNMRFASSQVELTYNGAISGTGGYEMYTTSNTYSNSVWYNIVFVVDMTQPLENRVIIYVDGVEQTTTVTTSGTPAGIQSGPAQFAVGGSVSSTGVLRYQINAIVDETAIWNRALSSDEVKALYDIQKDGCESGSYPFDALIPRSIKGVVNLNSTNVEGAKVRLINDTTDSYVGDTLTDVNGAYEFNVSSDTDDYHAMVEYESGGNKYHAVSYPFIKGGEDE